MGLDMYLIKRRKGQKKHQEESELIYWRKANQIHKWFADNCNNGSIENCEYIKISKKQLENLRDTCSEILKNVITKKGKVQNGQEYKNGKWEPILEEGNIILNPEICEELMPTQEGFFFGSTNYDNYYLDEIQYTLSQVEDVLETFDFTKDNIYYTAWW